MSKAELHKCEAYHKFEARKFHIESAKLYKEHGSHFPGHSMGMQVFEIRDMVAAEIRKVINEYNEKHPKPHKITLENKRQYRQGRYKAIHNHKMHISEDIAVLTSSINGLHQDANQKFENTPPPVHEGQMYFVAVLQKWCNRAIRQLMQAAVHYLHAQASNTTNDGKFLKASKDGEQHKTKAVELRRKISEHRRAKHPSGTADLEPARDAEDMRAIHARRS